jgi:hypothetical protein
MKKFKEYFSNIATKQVGYDNFINEGGNARTTSISGEEVLAQKIDMEKFNRTELRKDLLKLFKILNLMFEKEYGELIWNDFSVIEQGIAFNGSSTFLMDIGIEDSEYTKFKKLTGDIDLITPSHLREKLWRFLQKIKGEKITPKFVLIGDNKPSLTLVVEQINVIFEYTNSKKNKVNLQVDFELSEFDNNNQPSEFARFGHSSSWEDIKQGLKGVAHKYMMRSITTASSIRTDVLVFTKTATIEKPRFSKSKQVEKGIRTMSFFVGRGLRTSYELVRNEDGTPFEYEGKFVYRPIATKDSTYEDSVESIYHLLFSDNADKSEIKKMWSFVGLLDLLKKYSNKSTIEDTFDKFIDLLWGPSAQKLERDKMEIDMEVKDAAYYKFVETFTFLNKKESEIKELRNEFYQNYLKKELGESFSNFMDRYI